MKLKKILKSVRQRLRLRRHVQNQLMMLWLKQDLRLLSNLETAIDIGCGKFINRRYFKNDKYVGIDQSAKHIRAGSKEWPNSRGLVGDVLEPMQIKGDLVVCTLVLNNKFFPKDKTILAVNNLIDGVKKDGALILTMANINAQYEPEVDRLLEKTF